LGSDARRRDTVSSVGIVPRTLPFTASSTSTRYFRHAISLDERRAKFKANYYHLQRPDDQGTIPGELSDDEYDNGPTAADVLEVWFAGCHSGNSACLNVIHSVLTSFCRHWWGISPEWHSEQLGKNPTSLDDSPMLSC
jgi:uncharacterized protein (DUF2235 family)